MTELRGLLCSRITLVWAVLIVATVASLLLGRDQLVSPATLAGALIIVVAFVKVRFVGLYFMELRSAPAGLRWAFEAYCGLVGVTLVTMLLLAS
jgi:hypothetical protein